ncbi:olfactory receptor 1E16-like [Pelodiscus sinensis]|uniref:olfactory receptor 1E16-like n=1 Tax=Pelodiscus sinensis TaxID=13735 RepID=UPI003F6C6F05
MQRAEEGNQTLITEFILLGFGNGPELQPLLFLFFLASYIVTVAGNILIIVLVVSDPHLHTPMYYLLCNLACVETCYSSIFLPRLLVSLVTGDRTISVKGCIVQLYFFGIMSNTESLLLTAMSYDRYIAICHPLRYTVLMSGKICSQLVALSFLCSLLSCTILNIFFFQLTFCGSNEIDHYFCDFSPVIKVSCSDTRILQLVTYVVASLGTLVPCLLTLVSYIYIISTILRIPSSIRRQKAFSTCSTHLIVITVFYGAVIAVYMVPTANMPKVLHKIFSLYYIVLTPLINPIIYCLRNKEINKSLRKAFLKKRSTNEGQDLLPSTMNGNDAFYGDKICASYAAYC